MPTAVLGEAGGRREETVREKSRFQLKRGGASAGTEGRDSTRAEKGWGELGQMATCGLRSWEVVPGSKEDRVVASASPRQMVPEMGQEEDEAWVLENTEDGTNPRVLGTSRQVHWADNSPIPTDGKVEAERPSHLLKVM